MPLAADQPVHVFVLAGQSNMEGKAKVSLLEHQAHDPNTAMEFAHVMDGTDFRVWEKVRIKFLDRKGKLTAGFGSPNCIGPELGFGEKIAQHIDGDIVLIKTAWGGKSLFRDFRPPSSGMPSEETLEKLLQQARNRKPKTTAEEISDSFGYFYREMVSEVRETLDNVGEHFPELADRDLELAGFVWFQGWNDMVNDSYTAEYAENMANFIRDVRKDLGKPNLPFVIGQLGVGGLFEQQQNPKKQAFKDAQAQAAELPEFEGNVSVVPTDVLWDMRADAVFQKGWKENLEEWNTIGSDYPYHYLGSARAYLRMGNAFAQSVLELMGVVEAEFYTPEVRDIEGWTVEVDPLLVSPDYQDIGDQAMKALANHLQRVKYIVPQDRIDQLVKLPIRLELFNRKLTSMQYHPDRGWLVAHRHDPHLVNRVHIPRATALFDSAMWAKHPYVVLHELAHSYHDQVLGFDHPEIIAAFEEAKEKGSYEDVLLYTGERVRHYGLSNHKEYFAESTEAYFGVNDFYPFVRAELKEHDPRMFELLEKIWGKVK
ncbi:MAG: hypothetical protein KDB27_10885 [Planctomycetales bacterium]|nr:hypothetical protein [Planctomycetales bacterium]